MAQSIDQTIITVAAILTSGGVMFRGMYLAYKLLKDMIAKDVYKEKYDEIIKKLIDSSRE